jgi:hypothetical protein
MSPPKLMMKFRLEYSAVAQYVLSMYLIAQGLISSTKKEGNILPI